MQAAGMFFSKTEESLTVPPHCGKGLCRRQVSSNARIMLKFQLFKMPVKLTDNFKMQESYCFWCAYLVCILNFTFKPDAILQNGHHFCILNLMALFLHLHNGYIVTEQNRLAGTDRPYLDPFPKPQSRGTDN